MNASDYAAWYGAVVATGVFFWDVMKWTQSGPRLTVRIPERPGQNPTELQIVITNVGDAPAAIETVRVRLFEQGDAWRKHEINVEGVFGLSCRSQYPPRALAPAEPWTVSLFQYREPGEARTFSKAKLTLVIEVVESHRKRPYRLHPDLDKFRVYADRQTKPGITRAGFIRVGPRPEL